MNRHFLKDIKKGIKNMIYWLPVIWKDRDWDFVFFLKIIEHKLKSMKKFYLSDDIWSVEAPEIAKKIDECLSLCTKIINDDYEYIYSEHNEKWGNPEFDFSDLQLKRKSAKILTEEDTEKEEEEFLKLIEKEDLEKQNDIDTLFSTIAKELRRWWD